MASPNFPVGWRLGGCYLTVWKRVREVDPCSFSFKSINFSVEPAVMTEKAIYLRYLFQKLLLLESGCWKAVAGKRLLQEENHLQLDFLLFLNNGWEMALHRSPSLASQLEAEEMVYRARILPVATGWSAVSPGNESLPLLVSILSTEERHPTITYTDINK